MPEIDASDLDELPSIAGQVASALCDLGTRLNVRAVDQLLDTRHRASPSPRLGAGQFRWRLRLSKQGERIVLFFIRNALPEVPVVDAEVRIRMTPVPPSEADGASYAKPVRLLFEPPPFIVFDASQADVARYTGDPDAAPENTILLRAEEPGEVLAIVDPEDGLGFGKKATLYHTIAGEAPVRLGEGSPPWPLPPFRSVISSLASWLRSGESSVSPRPLDLDDEVSDITRVLDRVVQAYRMARWPGTQSGDPPSRKRPAPFDLPRPRANQLSADLSLRLDEDGNLIDQFDKDTFQLRMSMRIQDEGDWSEGLIKVNVPDFLARGETVERLLEALRSEEAVSRLTEELGKTPLGRQLADFAEPIVAADVDRILAGAEASAIVFRTRRKATSNTERRDTDLFAIRHSLNKASAPDEMLALFRGRFDIETVDGTTQVSIAGLGHLDVLHFGSLAGEGGEIDREDAAYFVRLAAELHRWNRALS